VPPKDGEGRFFLMAASIGMVKPEGRHFEEKCLPSFLANASIVKAGKARSAAPMPLCAHLQ
jgi:hypothetical protein